MEARHAKAKRPLWKVLLRALLGLTLCLVVFLGAVKAYRDAHYFDDYDPSAPLNVTIQESLEVARETPTRGYTIRKFTFDGYQGEKVPALLSLPKTPPGRKLPVVLLLHGIGQNKNFLKEITAPFNEAGFAFACFDQYTRGERKLPGKPSAWAQLEAFRQRPAKTINETRRLIDYLITLPEIDPQRIYLFGTSYGAVTGTTAMARDARLRAGVMVFGGGDFNKLLEAYANHLSVAAFLGMIDGKHLNPEKPPLPQLTQDQERKVGLVIGCLKPVVRYFLGAADPIRYVGKISPRPIYFQNGKYDVLVPAASGKALQDAAAEPKKVTWYEMDHVGINMEHTLRVLEDGLRWLVELDNPLRAREEQITSLPPFRISDK